MPLCQIPHLNSFFTLSYKISNLNSSRDVVFLHGWGSNKEAMMCFDNPILSQYRLVFIDLPGFGMSTNELAMDTYDYVQILKLFFEHLNIHPQVIVGHSFGGKIATLLNPPSLILLSSAGIVESKSLSVRLRIYVFKFFRLMGLGFLFRLFASNDVKGMSRNMYETFKKVVNEDFKDLFSKCTSTMSIFWGKDDKQTSLSSGKMIASLGNCVHFQAMEGDHFFFIDKDNSQIICNHIASLNL